MAVKKQRWDEIEGKSAPNRIIRELYSDAVGEAHSVTFRVVDLAPKTEQAERRPHWHIGFEEVIYFMSGTGRVWADGTWIDVTAGDSVLIPAEVVHATFNLTDEPLRLLCFFPVSSGIDDRSLADFTVCLE